MVDDSRPARYLAADERVTQAKAEASSSAQFVLCVHSMEESVLEVVGSIKHNVSREGGYLIRVCPPATDGGCIQLTKHSRHEWLSCYDFCVRVSTWVCVRACVNCV